MEEVKDLIKKVLKKRKISLYRLAKELGTTYPTVWRWKEGKTKSILPVFRKKLEEMLK